MLASPISSLASFMLGGWLNERFGWRMAFFVIGIPGLLVALAVKLTVREPRTRAVVARSPQPTIKEVIATLWCRRACRHLGIALILLYTMSLGLAPWYAAFMMRSHGMGTGELGLWLGSIFGLGGIAGALLGGHWAATRFAGDERGQMRMTAMAVVALLPCFVVFLTLPQKQQALLALIPLVMLFSVFLGPTYALMQRVVPDGMRATMLAVVMLLVNLIGMGLGPQIVGILSDAFTPRFGNDGLRYAMLTMSFVALWASFHFWRVGETIRQDLLEAQQC
jgi:predicted MFS family arabinose efflux permease